MQLELSEIEDGAEATIAVKGEVDLSNHLELHDLIDEVVASHDLRRVVLDVSDLSFIDSHGVRALMLLQEHTLAGRAVIVLRDPRAHLQRLIEIIGASSLFAVEDSTAAGAEGDRPAAVPGRPPH